MAGRYGYLLEEEREPVPEDFVSLPPQPAAPEDYVSLPPQAPAAPPPELPQPLQTQPTEVVDTAPKTAAYTTSNDVADEDDPIERVKAKLRERLFANDMESLRAKAPTENANLASANYARGGALIGSGIGNLSGNAAAKPDMSYADSLLKQGELDAQKLDKQNAEDTDFNQKLAIASLTDKSKAEKNPYDPELNDVNSAAYKAKVAEMEFASPGSYKRANDAAVASGLPHLDFNRQSIKAKELLSQQGSNDRNDKNNRTKILLQSNSFNHDDRKRAEEFARKLMGKEYDQRLQVDDERRKGNLVERGFLDPSNPPSAEFAKKMVEADIHSGQVQMYADTLDKMIKADVAKGLNPLDNAGIGQVYGLLRDAYRDWAKFGVPSGKDMEMIRDVVADPRDFSALVKNFTQPGYYNSAMQSIKDANEYAAHHYGYGAKGTGSINQPQQPEPSKDDIYKTGMKNRFGDGKGGEGNKPAKQPTAAVKKTPSGKPYAFSAKDKDTQQIVYFDKDGIEVK